MKQNIVRLLAVGLILGVVLGSIIPMASAISPQPEPPTKVSAKLQISEISVTSLIGVVYKDIIKGKDVPGTAN
jgi:hypothetical protein